MNIEQTLQSLSKLQYPRRVDVVDCVMDKVSAMPQQYPYRPSANRWRAFSVAAMLAVVIASGVYLLLPKGSSNDEIEATLILYNDYSSWTTVEEAANPCADLFDPENNNL